MGAAVRALEIALQLQRASNVDFEDCTECCEVEGSGICANCEADGGACSACDTTGRCPFCQGCGRRAIPPDLEYRAIVEAAGPLVAPDES